MVQRGHASFSFSKSRAVWVEVRPDGSTDNRPMCIHANMHACRHAFIHIFMHAYASTYTYTYTYVYIYIYVHMILYAAII